MVQQIYCNLVRGGSQQPHQSLFVCTFFIRGGNMNEYMQIAIAEAKKAYKKREVPVGAVIVKNNKVIAKAHNTRQLKYNVINHAEILAILKASKKIKDWRLDGCDLYVTLKPCSMCKEIILASRIKNVYYLIDKDSTKKDYYKTTFDIANNCAPLELEYVDLLSNFFKNKR